MKGLYSALYNAFVPVTETPEDRAAVEAGEPYFRCLRELVYLREADQIWGAAVEIGAADLENSFAHGFRLGVRLTLDALREGV